ncbi:12718_t:CDS:1, partial [Racocetra persica]
HVWPQLSPQKNGSQWEEFCVVKVLLHIRYRSLQQLTINDIFFWPDLFSYYIEKIERDLVNLFRSSVDNIDNCEFSDDKNK